MSGGFRRLRAAIAGRPALRRRNRFNIIFLERNGLLANPVEYPAAARNRARLRLQVMASHILEQVDTAIDIFWRSLDAARQNISA